MSPYYIMLALFVGSLLAAVMIKVPVTQPQFLGYRAVERYFGRFVLFFFVGMAQALVTAFGCLYFVGIQCVTEFNYATTEFATDYYTESVDGYSTVLATRQNNYKCKDKGFVLATSCDYILPNTLCSFDAAFCTQGLHSS